MILPLKKEVCNKELSEKLKALGVPQESIFYWGNLADPSSPSYMDEPQIIGGNPMPYDLDYKTICSAFTVAELGEMLPVFVRDHDGIADWFLISTHPDSTMKNYWYGGYYSSNRNKCLVSAHGSETEADARANILIYLLENSLIKL